MKRRVYVIISISIAILIILSITLIIYNLNNKQYKISTTNTNHSEKDNNKIVNNNIEKITEEASSNLEEKISANARIKYNIYYKNCGHTTNEEKEIPKEMVNLTQGEIEKQYPEWEIISFKKDYIELYKEESGICNEHYVVKETNNKIVIYSIDENNKLTLKEATDISTDYLPEADLISLEEGVKIIGREELNAYIENFE